jgi:long-chain fatty acid transport protein
MKRGDRSFTGSPTLLITILALLAQPVLGGGFSLYEQGSKALGLAGAFVAQADDPTTLFYNAGGLAFFEERKMAVGVTLVSSVDEEFVGLPPVPGPNATANLNSLHEPIPHFYWVQPINETWNFGLAVNAPFGLKTDWKDPDNFPGRFVNTEASMVTFDVTPNVGIKLSENLGLGLGAIVRFSSVEFNRRVPAEHPFTGELLEIGAANLESDLDQGLGWQIGLLHKTNESFSWGFAYRSTVTVDYGGDARFTQISTGNPQLDQLIAATFPFDQDLSVETEIEFPDMATFAVAFAVSPSALLELDVNWTGWSSFDTLAIRFSRFPLFDIIRPENWDDVYTYRLGTRISRPSGNEWRFGFVTDESPQPTAAVSPLLPDSDRNGYTIGWGHQGDRTTLDLALMYLDFDERVNDVSQDGFNGKYSQTGWLLATTVGF